MRAIAILLMATMLTPAMWTASGDQTGEQYATCCAGIGDVNGDGYDDVAVGSWYYVTYHPAASGPSATGGRVQVYHGGPSGPSAAASWTFLAGEREGWNMNENAGYALAGGDFNGDGFSDLAVGAHGSSDPTPEIEWTESAEGRVYVFYGGPSGLSSAPGWVVDGNQWNGFLGMAVAAGDLNGDGTDDLIAGMPQYFAGTYAGAAFAWYGSSTGLPTGPAFTRPSIEPNWSYVGSSASNYYAGSLATGDVNGDGAHDLIVGDWYGGNGQSAEGRVDIFHGSGAGPALWPNLSLEADQADAFFGGGVASGDVDADGFDDVIVGALWWDGGETDEGRIFVYRGGATGVNGTLFWSVESNQAGAQLGYSVAALDVDGDGDADVLGGAPTWSGAYASEGAVFVYSTTLTTPWRTETGGAADVTLGGWVADARDVNGDQGRDFIVGAPSADGWGLARVWAGTPSLSPPPSPAPAPGSGGGRRERETRRWCSSSASGGSWSLALVALLAVIGALRIRR